MFIEFDVYGYVKKDDPLRSGGGLFLTSSTPLREQMGLPHGGGEGFKMVITYQPFSFMASTSIKSRYRVVWNTSACNNLSSKPCIVKWIISIRLRWKCVGQLIDSITFYSIKCFRQNQPAHVQIHIVF